MGSHICLGGVIYTLGVNDRGSDLCLGVIYASDTGITSILLLRTILTALHAWPTVKGKRIKRARKQPPRFKDNAFEHASVNEESSKPVCIYFVYNAIY